MEYKILSLSELKPYLIRDIRDITLTQLKESINERGYNKSHLLSVIENPEGGYFVIDGNHRLKILEELNIHEIPCVIYPSNIDIYKLAIDCNIAEDTYAPMDLFDWLDIIGQLKAAKLTQKQIGEKIGWSRGVVSQYILLLDSIATEILQMAKEHQQGRVAENATNVAFLFTEGWFRNSGIYALRTVVLPKVDEDGKYIKNDNNDIENEDYSFQNIFMQWFINDKNCKAVNKSIKEISDSLLEQQRQLLFLDINSYYKTTNGGNNYRDETVDYNRIKEEFIIPILKKEEKNAFNEIMILSSQIDNYAEERNKLLTAILNGEYTVKSFINVLKSLNEGAKNRALFGVDSLEKLKEIKSNTINCVVTDPPWGVDFKPSRKTNNPHFDNNIEENIKFLDNIFNELKRICTANSHLYIFFPTKYLFEFKTLLNKYFEVEPIPLIWVKNNHNPCDFKQRYASQYETIFFCKCEKGNERKLNNDISPDILKFDKPMDKYHDCQKPIELLKYLITNSTGTKEIILDPFAGSGSTLLAAKLTDRYYIGFEIETKYESRFIRELGLCDEKK